MAGNPMWNNPSQPNMNNSMVTFINDDAMAMNYPVNPGMTVALLNVNDPNNGKLFLKSAEQNGCPNPMRIFKLQDVTPQKQNADTVSRQEFDQLNNDLREIKQLLAGLKPNTTGGK